MMKLLAGTLIFLVAGTEVAQAGGGRWISVETKHFTLVSDASETRTRELIVLLEQFRFTMTDIYKVEPPPTVVTMIVFDDDATFKPFKPLYNGKPALNTAITATGGVEDLVAMTAEYREQALEIILHEYTHILTSSESSVWPVWLAEGEAEVMSAFRWNKGKAILGGIKQYHVQILRTQPWLPLESLFDVTTKSPEYNERNRQGLFYAEAWALTHYLRFGDKGAHRGDLARFMRLLREGRSAKDAFQQIFGRDFDKLQQTLVQYIQSGSYLTYIPEYTQPDVDRDINVRSVADSELQALFGTWLVDVDRLDDADAYFQKSSAAAPNSARVRQWLGYRAFKRKDFATAAGHFEKAIGPRSQNYLAYYYFAAALFQAQVGNAFELGKADRTVCRTVSEAAVRATQLMPRFAPAYALLATVQLASGVDIPEGVKMAEIAIRLDPSNFSHRLTLAQLQLVQKNYSAARATLAPLLGLDVVPGVKEMANTVLKQIDRLENRR